MRSEMGVEKTQCHFPKKDGELCKIDAKGAKFCARHRVIEENRELKEREAQDAARQKDEYERRGRQLMSVQRFTRDIESDVSMLFESMAIVDGLKDKVNADETLVDADNKLAGVVSEAINIIVRAADQLKSARRQIELVSEQVDEEQRRLEMEKELIDNAAKYKVAVEDMEREGSCDRAKLKGRNILPPGGEFMSRADYRKLLQNAGLDTEGKDVFHIIASNHGGPDHTDNYLFALGTGFNRGISDRLDELNCYIGGREATRKAVDIALRVARDPTLHKHIDKRKRATATLYTVGAHAGKDGEALYKKGCDYMRTLRRESRHQS